MPKPASQQAKQLTASILEYLALYERNAALCNDRNAVWHFQECWRVVFQTFYGGYSLPRRSLPSRSVDHGTAVPAAKPQWFTRKYSRPARKVVMQVAEQQQSLGMRNAVSGTYDVLACGHKMLAAYKEDGSSVSKWRYCNECEAKPSAASSDRARDSRAA